MDKSVLLIVDIQKALVENEPWGIGEVLNNVKKLLFFYRERNLPIVYIQHNGAKGSVLEPGSCGWEIADEIKPLENEVVINKGYNSSFKNTTLESTLRELECETLVLTGMQTEYCIDTTCRVAFEKGFKVVVPEMSNTTFDTELLTGELIYKHHNYKIFHNRFAQVESVESILEKISLGETLI